MIELLKKHVESAKQIVLFGHYNPDGDALGATLGLKSVLRNMGKEVAVIFPNDFPDNLSWLGGADEVLAFSKNPDKSKEILSLADFMVMLDFNDLSRLNDLEGFIPDTPFAMIDHHPLPKLDTPMSFSDTSASSTCEKLTEIIYDASWDKYIDKDAATALFVGILTDTGRFNHNSSNPKTYRMVANLLEKGVDKDAVIDAVFDSYSENRMRLMGYMLNDKLEVFLENGFALMVLSMADKDKFNYQIGDSEGFVNMPLSIAGITRSVFLQEYEDKVRMSFRSKGDIVINDIATEHFNGGGHKNAAGGTSFETLEKTILKLKMVMGIRS